MTRAGLLGLAIAIALACIDARERGGWVGTVERTVVEVSAPVSEVIVELPVRRGEAVEAGQIVARLDDAIARAQRDAAAARLEAARARLRETGPDLERVVGLFRGGVASSHELDHARRAHDEARALDREARARLAEAERRLAEHVLRAPVGGVVDQIPFDRGERIPVGGVVVVILADEAPWVRVWLPARVVARLSSGADAVVHVDGIAEPLRGRVVEIGRESEFTPHYALTEREREHLVYRARVEIEEAPDGLRPGLPAEVELPELGAQDAP